MKKVLFLIVMWAVCGGWASAQTGFDVLWKIDNWGSTHKLSVSTFARFSPDGKSIYFVADSSYDKLSRVYQISSETGEPISQSEGGKKIIDFDMSEAGNVYVTVQLSDGLKIWDATTHKALFHIKRSPDTSIVFAAISPDEKHVIFVKESLNSNHVTTDHVLCIYDIQNQKTVKEIPSMYVTELRYSRDGKTFVAGGVGKVYYNGSFYDKERLILYDATNWTQKAVLAETWEQTGFSNIHYSFDGKYVAATASRLSCINNIETLEKREFTDYPSYNYAIGLTLLKSPNDYIVEYINITTNLSKCVIYNDNKEVNSFDWAYYFLATNNNNDKFKIFACNGPIAVLVPTSTSVKENDDTIITLSHSENLLTVSSSKIESQSAKILISDVSGKVVYAGVLELKDSDATQIPMKLDNGIYLYKIFLNSKEFTGKFEVVK